MTVPEEEPRPVAGLLLAAGGGRRMGRPKALVADPAGGTFLERGLRAVAGTGAEAVIVLLVDLPDVGPQVLTRLLAATAGEGPAVLARAAYEGVPGHPVLIGREHWAAVLDGATGDRGARDHLATHPHTVVECGDLASGRDADTPADLT